MSARRFLGILAAAIGVIAIAMGLGRLRQAPADGAGALLLPQIAGQLGAIERVTIRRGAAQPAVTLQKRGERWTVLERADYPADTAKLRKLLLAIAGARVLEEKTADPARYAILGVDDPQRPGALGTEIALTTPAGTQVLVVGKASMGGNFARLGGAAQSLLVAPAIAVDREPRDWIDARIVTLKPADIREARVKPATGAAAALPDSRFAALASLTAQDVAPAAGVKFGSAVITTVTLADGSTLTLSGAVSGDNRWLTISSDRDAVLNARTRDVAFGITSSSFDAIFKP